MPFFLGKSPPAISWSVLSVCPPQIYMYAAWNGWTIPMFLFLALLRLSLNYLIARSFFSPWFISTSISLAVWTQVRGECTLTFTCVFPWCTALRGWRIQWSIVPEVSEPVVRTWIFAAEAFRSKDNCWCWGLWCFQEPPKEDLTVSEKFQLVLDVAQKAQVRPGGQAEALHNVWPRPWLNLHHNLFQFPPPPPLRICLGGWQTSWRKYGSELVGAR